MDTEYTFNGKTYLVNWRTETKALIKAITRTLYDDSYPDLDKVKKAYWELLSNLSNAAFNELIDDFREPFMEELEELVTGD